MLKKSVQLTGHQTSVLLEEAFWDALKKLAEERKTSVRQLIIAVDNHRTTNLASALRVFVLTELQKKLQK